jgi:hypothetical protein
MGEAQAGDGLSGPGSDFTTAPVFVTLSSSMMTETLVILLNCDTGESFATWRRGRISCSDEASPFVGPNSGDVIL